MPPRTMTKSSKKSKRKSAEQDIRLAEEQCQRGQYLQALLLAEPYPKHPLAWAVRLHVMVARYELTRALEEGQHFLAAAKRTNHPEAMARIHQHLANAAWSLNQKERHQEHLQQAQKLALQCNNTDLLASLAATLLYNTDTNEMLDLNNPMLGLVGSLESRFKTLRLLLRHGEYRLALNALDSALEKRIGGAIKESLKIALGERLATRLPETFEHRPWLLALEGITHLDVDLVLSSGPVQPSLSSQRGLAIWHLANAWARLRCGQLSRTTDELLAVSSLPFEPDLKLWRNFTVLALAVHHLALAQRVAPNLHDLMLETMSLTKTLPTHTPLLVSVPRSLPEAHALLHTLFPHEPAFAQPPILLIGGVGVRVHGVLRAQSSSQRALALGEMPYTNARTAALYRWRRLLRSLNHPVAIQATQVLTVLQHLASHDPKIAPILAYFQKENAC